VNRYEAFPDMGGATARRRDHRLIRRRIVMIAIGIVLLIGAVIATVLFGGSLTRKQANATWGVITAVSAPAVSPAMAASLAAKTASFTPAASAPLAAASAPAPAPAPVPAAAPAAAAPPSAAPIAAAAAAAAPAPASIAEATKMMDTAALADKPAKDPIADKLPDLTVAPTVDAISGQSASFAMSVNDGGVLPDDSRISIHGVPQDIALSAGRRDAAGDWMLSPDDLNGLTVTPSNTAVASTSDLLVQLKAADGKVANEWHTVLNVTSSAREADRAAAFSVTEKASPDDIKSWMSHGRDLERVGYLAGARLFFQRAAEAGSAEGARALAETYDPAEFEKLGVHGMEPDPAQAQKWYERAKVLEAKSAAPQSGTAQ
jgi:TPR repeat protein